MAKTELSFPARSYDFCDYVTAKNFVDGKFVDAVSGQSLEVINPRHGKVMGKVVLSGAEDLAAVVSAAKKAQANWGKTPLRERAQVLFRLRQLIERDVEELAWLVSHENGKTFAESKASVEKGIECLEFGTALENMGAGEKLDVSRGISCEVWHEPLGIVAGITPFNFPVMVPLWMIPQALVGGNAFILKPSEQTPYGAMKLALLLKEAGLPDGLFSILNGQVAAVEALCDHPDVKAIGFVGSTKVARIVYARGSQQGKKMLCLGGAKNHLVVVPDADVNLTAENVVASAFGCAGQRCMAASVMLAVGDVQPIVDKLVGIAKKLQVGNEVGAIINKQSVERITRYIDQAEKMGAKVLVDGRGARVPGSEGYWVGPTILDQVSAEMPCATEEIFGPVLSIRRVKSLDEAIAIENAVPYGNAACIYTTSGAVARYALERFEAGMCAVNVGVPVPREPFSFGGWNDSKFGQGDITGYDGFRFWTRPRKVTTKWALQNDTTWMG